jgi:regulator of replication initiation timing
MKTVIRLSIVLLFASVLQAQTATQTATPEKKASKPVSADVQALKDAVAAQQEQIKALSQQLQQTNEQLQQTNQQLQRQLQQAQAAAADAASKAAAAQAQASDQQQAVGELKSEVTGIKTDAANAAATLQEAEKRLSAFEGPTTLHIKGINITPGGFAEAAFVRRSRELGADLPTPFNSLTMPGASQSQMSEFFGSARQSRPTIFIAGRLKNVELSSYISIDFLAAGVTSTATQTNSYTPRLRQAWAQAKFNNGWKFLGGQMWSLVTENKGGIAPSDDLGKVNDARPATIDPSYNVGFSFARQYGLRVTKDFGTKFSVAFAMENAQGTLTTHNNDDNFLLGEAGASNSYNTTANYTANPSPDLIAKAAFDPGFGHYEVFGLLDRFRDRVFPCYDYTSPNCAVSGLTAPSAVSAYNASKEGGGIGANARWIFANKHVVFGLHGFGGSGVGRYGAAQLSDLSINPNGTVHLLKSYQGLGTLEWHGKKLDLYSYAGVEYAGRAYGHDNYLVVPTPVSTVVNGVVTTTTTYPIVPSWVGYGSPEFRNDGCDVEQPPSSNSGFGPGSLVHCAGDTRAVIEGTAGLWYRFYNGPMGKFQFGAQYSYVTRQTWAGTNSAGTASFSPEGLDSMIFTSFRYYLP